MIAETAFLTFFSPLVFISMAVAMLVLRAGASRIFFDVVGTYQAGRMITDAQASATVLESLYLDSLMGIQEAAAELNEMFTALTDATVPLAEEIESARIELDKFLDAGEDLGVVSEELEKIGLRFGFAADEAFEAGAKMAQLSGVLGGGTTPVGTELGVMFGLISGMETEAAMQRLINLQQQTKFMTASVTEGMTEQEKINTIRRDSIRILDQLNTVENRSAATMQQITFVMNQFASQAHLTGESIAAMAAMSATLIEAGEEQGKGGRALRMIYARLGADTNGARSEIERLGIAVYDAEGQMRPFSDILEELAKEYEGMNDRQKMATVQTVAGNRHYTRLIKLLENVDRVRELELEAMIAQFPARDELNRRLESEVFAYQQSEAAVKNAAAAFGDSLLPAMTSVQNRQAQFFDQLTNLTEGPMGGMITGLLVMSMSLKTFLGPTFNAIIAIKGLSVAMQTQAVVTRALNGEQIANAAGMRSNGVMYDATTLKLDQHTQQLFIEKAALEASIQKREQDIQKWKAYQQEIDRSARSKAAYAGHTTKAEAALAAESAALDEVNIKLALQDTQLEKNTNEMLLYNLRMTKSSMVLGGLGSVMMAFGKSEDSMRRGMALTTIAMGLQMFQVYKSINAMAASTKAKILDAGATNAATVSNNAMAASFLRIDMAAIKAASGITKAKLSVKAFAKATIALAIAMYAFEKISSFLFKGSMAQDIEEVNMAVADTGLVLEYMNLSEQELLDTLTEKRNAIDAVKDSQSALGQETLRALQGEEAALQRVLDMRMVASYSEENESVKEYFRLQQDIEDVMKNQAGFMDDIERGFVKIYDLGQKGTDFIEGLGIKIPDSMKGDSGVLDFFTGGKVKEREDAQEAMDEFTETNYEFANWMKQQDFSNIEDAMIGLGEYAKTVNREFGDDTTGIVGSMQEAQAAVENFNNAREELFFGFSSDNLTGNLIRQVQQQGVETLITSTEVIMTNNFNGMTVPEVADQIIEEIESRGNFRGYNFATVQG